MNKTLSVGLASALLMFPNVVETIYSPALPALAQFFAVNEAMAGQTLSIYFVAFALGVLVWGRLCDRWGCKRTLLLGLGLYGLASLMALRCTHFDALLAVRALAAFGAAACSVVTQTLLRQQFSGQALTQVFAKVGTWMAFGPALGVFLGALCVGFSGHQAVFVLLCGLALLLLITVFWGLPESQTSTHDFVPLRLLLPRMFRDQLLLCAVFWVALWNVSLFAYYQLAPFQLAQMTNNTHFFGGTGVLIGAGVGLGGWLSHQCARQQWSRRAIFSAAISLHALSACGLYFLQNQLEFVGLMLGVMTAYGLAIPNILAQALVNYDDCKGSAGAVFGCLYYTLFGLFLVLVGWFQQLALTLMLVTLGLLVVAWFEFGFMQKKRLNGLVQEI
jgi:MFS family permease